MRKGCFRAKFMYLQFSCCFIALLTFLLASEVCANLYIFIWTNIKKEFKGSKMEYKHFKIDQTDSLNL